MKTKGILGLVAAIVLTANALPLAAPVDHVYVSSNKLDMLNLDGSLNKVFLPGSTDGICRALAVDGNTGNVWLACETAIASNNRVYLFDSIGNILRQCSNTPQFCAVVMLDQSICVDPIGNAWINDRVNNQVYKYTPSGTRAGPYSTGVGTQPWAISCDRIGNIWTANNSTNNISKIGNDGSLLATYPMPVAGNPKGIAIDQYDNIWVSGGGYISKFSQDGSPLGQYSASLANKLAIDNNGNIWVSGLDQVFKFDNQGNFIGVSPVASPTYISIDASGNAWVVSGGVNIKKLSNSGINLGTFPLSGNSGQNDTGFLHKRFVLGYNSVDGPDVWVPLNSGAPAGAVTLWFDYINTKGDSSYIESGAGTAPPGGWKLGTPSRYYDITSTVTYTGNIDVCIGYNESEFSNEAALRLFHNDGSWTDVTTSLDAVNNVVCGTVTGLSEFAPMEPAGGPGPIPTVSEWVLILMAALLMIVLASRLRRYA